MPTIKNLGSEKEIQYTSLAEKGKEEAKRKAAEEKKREDCFQLANGFVHEHQFWNELKHEDRMLRVKMLATWLRDRCDEAVDEAGSFEEGVTRGRELQKEDDEELLKQMTDLRRELEPEGDQTLINALQWKLSEENRVLREEVAARVKEAHRNGFELGVDEMRLRVENRTDGFIKAVLNAQADELVSRGPDVK